MKLINISNYKPEQILYVSTTAEVVDALQAFAGDITYRNKTVLVIKDGTYEPADDIDVNSDHWDLITSESGTRGSVYLDFTAGTGGTFSINDIDGTNLIIKGVKIAETVYIGSVEGGYLIFENCESNGGDFDNYGISGTYYHPRISFINCFDDSHGDGFTLLNGVKFNSNNYNINIGLNTTSGIYLSRANNELRYKRAGVETLTVESVGDLALERENTGLKIYNNQEGSPVHVIRMFNSDVWDNEVSISSGNPIDTTTIWGNGERRFLVNTNGNISIGDLSTTSYTSTFTLNVYDDTRPGQMFYYGTDPVAFIGSSGVGLDSGALYLYDGGVGQVEFNGTAGATCYLRNQSLVIGRSSITSGYSFEVYSSSTNVNASIESVANTSRLWIKAGSGQSSLWRGAGGTLLGIGSGSNSTSMFLHDTGELTVGTSSKDTVASDGPGDFTGIYVARSASSIFNGLVLHNTYGTGPGYAAISYRRAATSVPIASILFQSDSGNFDNGNISLGTAKTGSGGPQTRLFIKGSNGRVGINTTTPGYGLHVNSDLRADKLYVNRGVGAITLVDGAVFMPGVTQNITVYDNNTGSLTILRFDGGVLYNIEPLP